MSNTDQKTLRFDHFMQHALHDPQTGYYANSIQTIGATGDFSTTATLSNILGRAIANSALDWHNKQNTPLNLIEVGGGDGSLAQSIIKSIPFTKRWKLNYHLVDNSTPLTKQQQQRTKLKRKVTWHDNIISALKGCKGTAFIFSNELVDAFPVRVFKRSSKQNNWEELYIQKGTELFKTCSDKLPQSSSFAHYEYSPEQRVEVHQSYKDWLTNWLPHWETGQLLTIDYGDVHPDIYYRMPKGTLRAYSHHQHITGKGVYQNPGKQDITADVNFTDLMQWGENDRLSNISLLNQAEYLKPFARATSEDQFLIHPEGAGTAFKVLLQQKNT